MRRYGILIVLASLLASGCNTAEQILSEVSGHYEGSLTTHLDGSAYTQAAVRADIGADQKRQSVVDVVDESASKVLSLTILAGGKSGTASVQSSLGMRLPVTLSADKDGSCYSGSSEVSVTLCVSHPELSLEIRDPKTKATTLSLVLHPFKVGDAVDPRETPRAYTLDEAIELARTKSFSSRIEYEHVIQAKARMKAAYLHLLPQLTFNTIVNVATAVATGGFGWTTVVSSLGDLAPFLFPTRWLQAAQAKNQAKAEQDGNTLMRLSMGLQAEGLFYAYARDVRSRELTKELLAKAMAIRDEVRVGEDWGQLAKGSTANMNTIVNQIEQNLNVFQQITAEDLGSISQTLGYFMPTTVTDVTISGESVPIENAQPLDFKSLNAIALSRALELDQMDDLIEAAKIGKTSMSFSWLDPYGDPSLGLGAALPAQIEVASSQIRELRITKQQLQAVISQKVFSAVTDHKQALESFKLAKDLLANQDKLLDITLTQLRTGVNVDFFGLVNILQTYLNAEIQVETARANYRAARSTIDRLLLQGYYSKF